MYLISTTTILCDHSSGRLMWCDLTNNQISLPKRTKVDPPPPPSQLNTNHQEIISPPPPPPSSPAAASRGIGGNVVAARVGARMMTISLLLSLATCGSHAFMLAGRPATCLHGRHHLTIPGGGQRRRSGGNNNLYACVISKGRSHLRPSPTPAPADIAIVVARGGGGHCWQHR